MKFLKFLSVALGIFWGIFIVASFVFMQKYYTIPFGSELYEKAYSFINNFFALGDNLRAFIDNNAKPFLSTISDNAYYMSDEEVVGTFLSAMVLFGAPATIIIKLIMHSKNKKLKKSDKKANKKVKKSKKIGPYNLYVGRDSIKKVKTETVVVTKPVKTKVKKETTKDITEKDSGKKMKKIKLNVFKKSNKEVETKDAVVASEVTSTDKTVNVNVAVDTDKIAKQANNATKTKLEQMLEAAKNKKKQA